MSTPPSASPALTAQELAEYEALAEEEWRAAGVAETYIDLSRRTGMDAQDLATLTDFSRAPPVLLIVRCPKVQARALHRVVRRPKSLTVKIESGDDGVTRPVHVEKRTILLPSGRQREVSVYLEREYVSDYDLMSVWRIRSSGAPTRLRIAPKDKPVPLSRDEPWRGAFTVEAAEFMRSVNRRLISKFQHGCQDDMRSIFNRGVSKEDRFAAFFNGSCEYLHGREACREFYEKQRISWPYKSNGRFDLTG